MDKVISLNRNGQFQRLYKKGKSIVAPSMVVYVKRNGLDINRLGITASKKIGKAVARNRAKRRIRELYRSNLSRFKKGYDFVIVARTKTVFVSHEVLSETFLTAADKLGVLNEQN